MMIRVCIVRRSCSLRGVRRFTSDTTAQQRQRLKADKSLSDKFNLAELNGGKNPFNTASDRLMKPASTKKDATELRDVYSLEYLVGEEESAKKPTKTNPFEVPSDKLM